jgi:hypothetical protein
MDLLKKLRKGFWKKRKLCFIYENNGEINQEWFGVDMGAFYILCEVAGLQVCYEVAKPLVAAFMREKKISGELSCA